MLIMTAANLVAKAKQIEKTKTVYMWGTYGRKVTQDLITAKAKQYPKQYSLSYQKMLSSKIGHFAWDCVGLIKGILWGWDGVKNVPYAPKKSMPDMGANTLRLLYASKKSKDWSKIVPGAAVFMPGHVGIYIGDGLVIEATPSFANGVQITAVKTLAPLSKYPLRTWSQGWGLLPWVDYTKQTKPEPAPVRPPVGDYYLYTVKKGDSPWSIAVQELGDGRRFTEITALNGIEHPYTIYTGMQLRIPGKTGAAAEYVVKKGDTLWAIAKEQLHDANKWQEIARVNNIKAPYTIRAGQVLKLGTAIQPAQPAQPKTYKVRITAKAGLNYRSGPGTNYAKHGAFNHGQTVVISKEQSGWGYVTGKGWIALRHTESVR